MRVLLVEDEPSAARMLAKGLREHGYAVDVAGDGEEALYQQSINAYDLIILDIMLPRKDGFEVCRTIRAGGSGMPILMLTARDAVSDRISGLDCGADDYLTKPFDFGELIARLRALQRRPPLALPPVLECGDLHFEPATREITVACRPVAMTATESALIELLLRRSPAVVTRRQIATQIWEDEASAVGSNTIDVHMGRVRSKLSKSRARIETVRGM